MDFDVPSLIRVRDESYHPEVPVWIDHITLREASISIACFTCLLVLAVVAGCLGTEAPVVTRMPRMYRNDSRTEAFSTEANSLSPINRVVEFHLSFLVHNRSVVLTPVTFTYRVMVATREAEVTQCLVTFRNKSFRLSRTEVNNTNCIGVFRDELVTYGNAEMILTAHDIDHRAYSGVTFYLAVGTRDHTIWQIYFRFFYSLFEFIPVFLWVRRGQYSNVEQQLSLALLILAICSNNPFYFWHAIAPQAFFTCFDALVTPLFHASLCFACLVLFDFLVYKNGKWDFRLAVCFSVVYFITGLVYRLTQLVNMLATSFFWNVRPLRLIVASNQIIFVIFALTKVFIAVVKVDLTERFKFAVYFIGTVMVSGFSMLVSAGDVIIQVFGETEFQSVVILATSNTFVLMLAYYHWPNGKVPATLLEQHSAVIEEFDRLDFDFVEVD
jgi:hypothetical protein